MKKHFRLILATLCLGVLLLGVFILVVNLYVQSQGMQNRIRSTLSSALGMPVGVFRTTFSPWGGFRLDQIEIASDIPGARTAFLKANFLEVRCELLSLMRGRVVLKRIALDTPRFVFQQNNEGKFRLPKSQRSEKTGPNPPTESPAPASTQRADTLSFPATDVRKFLLRGGDIKFLANDGKEILRLESVRCSLFANSDSRTFSGILKIEKAVIFNVWEITGLEAPVSFDRKVLTIQKMRGNLAEGQFEVAGSTDLSAPGLPYKLELRVSKSQLAYFLPQNNDTEQVSGLLSLRLDLSGFGTQEEKNTGQMEIKVSRADFSALPIFQLLNRVMGPANIGDFSIKRTQILGEIVGSTLEIKSSLFDATRVQFTFTGPVDEKQNIDLEGCLLVDDSLYKKLPKEARTNFIKDPNRNMNQLSFNVNGTIDEPRTDLVNRLIGGKLERKIESIFGDKKSPAPETKAE